MVRPKSAPTNSARLPVIHTFPRLFTTPLQNGLRPIMNANKKHGLRPVVELYAEVAGKKWVMAAHR